MPFPREPQAIDVPRALEEAVHFHQQGKLDEAEPLYRAVLKAIPGHFDAHHLLGVIMLQRGRHEEAISLISEALRTQPTSTAALSNAGLALQGLNRLAEAVAVYDKAIAFGPRSADALFNRGLALHALGRNAEALASFDRAIAAKPEFAAAVRSRGATLDALRRREGAVANYTAPVAFRPETQHKTVTVCVTSFDRFALLKQTIDSFMSLNTYPIERLVVIEDSTKPEMRDSIAREYGDRIDLMFNEVNLGQPHSIDKAYRTITTDYIFHAEDDYLYFGNPNFIQDSICILEERSDVHQVWLRHVENYLVSHGSEALYGEDGTRFFEDDVLFTSTGVPYRMLRLPHWGAWCGFSWNPGLRRTADYHRLFPDGYGAHARPGTIGYEAEFLCNAHARENGYRAALLVNGACINVGHEASTFTYAPRDDRGITIEQAPEAGALSPNRRDDPD